MVYLDSSALVKLVIADELTAIVTYDRRMAAAAGLADLTVAAPR